AQRGRATALGGSARRDSRARRVDGNSAGADPGRRRAVTRPGERQALSGVPSYRDRTAASALSTSDSLLMTLGPKRRNERVYGVVLAPMPTRRNAATASAGE